MGGEQGIIKGTILGKEPKSSAQARKLAEAGFESEKIQRFLPLALRSTMTGPFLEAGIGQIGELIQRPGGLSPGVSEAIAPRLAAESEAIGENFRGIRAEQAGSAARGNLPVSIKSALQSAIGIDEERAQRGARREALVESEDLRRRDLAQTYAILDALNQFITGRVGTSAESLAGVARGESQRQAANTAALGSIASAFAGGGGGGSK